MSTNRPTARELAERVPRVDGLCPEQIAARPGAGASNAVLVDQWGRAHRLDAVSVLGRDLERTTVAILEGSVSRLHAELRCAAGAWTVRDLGSTNGTFVAGQRAERETAVPDGALLTIGEVGFVLVWDRASLRARPVGDSVGVTAASPQIVDTVRLRLAESPRGGGVAEHGGAAVNLGSTQFALARLLAERRLAEIDQPVEVRGFVRTVELLSALPWDTAHPDDNHVKQIVRRVRRALERLGLSDAIESRRGFGYRLLVTPVLAGG